MTTYGRHRKYNKMIVILMSVVMLFMAAGCSKQQAAQEQPATEASAQEQPATEASAQEQPATEASGSTTEAAQQDLLQVQVLKVGKADAIVLMCGGKTMVIDCGEDEDGQEVLNYLEEKGVQKVDVLMITHFDKDHVGGADSVVRGIQVERVLLSGYTGAGKQYEEFMLALRETGIEPESVTEVLCFDLGGAAVTVEPPASYEIPDTEDEYDNDFSLITTVEIGEKRLVFAGDIEEARIREWLAGGTVQKCDVLKVPHHGVYNEALEGLFAATQPAYAVICDSKKNPADDRTLELLEQCGAQCFQTMNGDINILCDGTGIEIDQE